ncbi:hypothetical protein DAEQUDRAFT_726285 [Daedalea quercina L-15889]|uniref:Uncharacterized protein n=1 Tax=Daedalea quercina L-15889 TaxID=1314783 RepID=A0A165QM42_9APHY|nr:hypothetical protein DAEQUDRAFT_726285 [Daedalea quercina L-15889]
MCIRAATSVASHGASAWARGLRVPPPPPPDPRAHWRYQLHDSRRVSVESPRAPHSAAAARCPQDTPMHHPIVRRLRTLCYRCSSFQSFSSRKRRLQGITKSRTYGAVLSVSVSESG